MPPALAAYLSSFTLFIQQEKLAEDLSNCRAIENSLKDAFYSVKVCDATHPRRVVSLPRSTCMTKTKIF
jgi:hypothetical protein